MTNFDPQLWQGVLIIGMLFGVILLGVGVMNFRWQYGRHTAELKAEIDALKAEVEELKKR